MEYIVYGMIEPESKKIVYIDWMSWDWECHNDYPTKNEYLEYSLDEMNTNNEYDNPYWTDLARSYDYCSIGVVVLNTICNDKEAAQRLKEEYISILKPKYNNWGLYRKYFWINDYKKLNCR